MTPSRSLISVVLPAPFWTSSPKISPRSTARDTPLRAVIRPYCLTSLLVTMTATNRPLDAGTRSRTDDSIEQTTRGGERGRSHPPPPTLPERLESPPAEEYDRLTEAFSSRCPAKLALQDPPPWPTKTCRQCRRPPARTSASPPATSSTPPAPPPAATTTWPSRC